MPLTWSLANSKEHIVLNRAVLVATLVSLAWTILGITYHSPIYCLVFYNDHFLNESSCTLLS